MVGTNASQDWDDVLSLDCVLGLIQAGSATSSNETLQNRYLRLSDDWSTLKGRFWQDVVPLFTDD